MCVLKNGSIRGGTGAAIAAIPGPSSAASPLPEQQANTSGLHQERGTFLT
ncbi:MAG: hypothetical protein JOZ18_13985 [Chloroflexi bacterium]|nr:hypothetical protein [Chloroflexota bacterium]